VLRTVAVIQPCRSMGSSDRSSSAAREFAGVAPPPPGGRDSSISGLPGSAGMCQLRHRDHRAHVDD
jgi:hypothetical protein